MFCLVMDCLWFLAFSLFLDISFYIHAYTIYIIYKINNGRVTFFHPEYLKCISVNIFKVRSYNFYGDFNNNNNNNIIFFIFIY